MLLCSALMTAAYLLSIVIHGFFPGDKPLVEGKETGAVMWVPMFVLALLSVLVGIFPGALTSFIGTFAGQLF